MRETWQPQIGNPEPRFSPSESRGVALMLRTMAELHPGISSELCKAAGEIERLAFIGSHYRQRWVELEWELHALRNPPRDAEKARDHEDK